jgi:hypothetical protein
VEGVLQYSLYSIESAEDDMTVSDRIEIRRKEKVEYSNDTGRKELYSDSIVASREEIIEEYRNSILSVIAHDEFEDGEISDSEKYMQQTMTAENRDFILKALMKIYIERYNDEHTLLGVMEMISCKKYEEVEPDGQVMALGLLQHKNIYLRDRAIQVYEQWNSKKGIDILKELKCDQKWLQDYVDKVIMYLERDGE